MFSAYSFKFSKNAKYKDKFIFNGGIVDELASSLLITESEAFQNISTKCTLDCWILDSIRLKRALPLNWYTPRAENPFLSGFSFHFFQLEDLEGCIEKDFPLDLVKGLVSSFGGTLSETIVPSTTHIITQFQCEHLLPTQLLGPVQFVTPSWILKILNLSKYSDPSEAIDFPCPIHPIPESASITVCLSGFPAQERNILKAQVSLMGFQIENGFSPSTITHLVCKRFEGEKYALAKTHNLITVKRDWIDECYRTWKIIKL